MRLRVRSRHRLRTVAGADTAAPASARALARGGLGARRTALLAGGLWLAGVLVPAPASAQARVQAQTQTQTRAPVPAAGVRVAVAANFGAPMQALAQAFEQASGQRVTVAVGSTGSLYAQIRHGAPFEVLLAADDETPERLEREGLAVPGSRRHYATGRLVLWSAQPDAVDARAEVLRRAPAAGTRLAIANPKLAPYGRAALQTLQRLGLAPIWQPHLVQGENIAQVHQFVASGNAAMGFVALSQVPMRPDGQPATGSAWLVPAALHDPIRQDAVLLKAGQDNPSARALMAFLQTDAAARIIRGYGYDR